MERHLSLIKNELGEIEKRVFPRFPFSYFTFKSKGLATCTKAFEVVDISHTGMQLCLKDGGHQYAVGDSIKGELHWKGQNLEVHGTVKWVQGARLGMAFTKDESLLENVKSFLCVDNLVSSLRPIHQNHFDLELPPSLKYWLRADSTLEIFIWRHTDGELSKFHIILLDQMVEWADGRGLRSGKVITKRDMATPLFAEDEFMFRLDESLDEHKIQFARSIVTKIADNLVGRKVLDFMMLKLGASVN